MNTPTMPRTFVDPRSLPEVPPPGVIGGDMNQRGGLVDILDTEPLSKIDEALVETFPASDPPAFTQAGVYLGPPPRR
jgi:hypothetical protein